jgi:FHA domain
LRVAAPGALWMGMAKSRPGKSSSSEAGSATSASGHAGAPPKTPVRTDPLTDAQRGAWFDGPDVITAIRELDGTFEYDLPRAIQHFMVGASHRGSDMILPIPLPGRGLSAKHCLLERRADRIRLIDQRSTNGTYFQDRKIDDVLISPGDTFTLAPVTFLAMNDEMRAHRPTFVEVLGTGSTPSPDKLLIEAARGSTNLVLTGEPNCDQERLAPAIHAVSLRRRRPLVEIAEVPEERAKQRAIIDRAARSTLVLSIGAPPWRIDPTFVSMVTSPSYHVRLIVLAATVDAARAALSRDAVDRMRHVWVRPLALRSDEIDRLLDRTFAEQQSVFRSADLRPGNLAALRAHDWPDNLAGLRLLVREIVTYVGHRGMRPAAKSLGISKSTLQKRFDRIGLSLPLFSS